MSADVKKKRTFLFCGHAQSGKTSIVEALLFKCGAISRLGSVSEGTTVSDYEDDEKDRESSINLSVVNAKYRGNELQCVDTPGYLDFIGEVIMGARAADFAVMVVDAVEGVGVGTEKAWEIIQREKLPCLFFINKLDKDNADYQKTLDEIKKSLTKKATSFSVVEGKNSVNVLKEKGKNPQLYKKIVETVAESDDELCEKYLETGTLSDEEVVGALKTAIENRQFFPVIGGAALMDVGIESLLDVIVEDIPSVGEAFPRLAKDKEGQDVPIEPAAEAPFCAQVFKTIIDPFVGQLTVFRVLSGTLHSNGDFYNASKEAKEKFGQLYSLQGKQQVAQESVSAGDIAAIAKLKETETQDTICASSRRVLLPGLQFPSPAYSASIKPKTRQDEDKISSALARLRSEDPTCNISIDAQTKELIISGMGELHIHIIIDRMKRKYHADVELGTPKVPYLETIAKKAQVSHKYKKQTGGKGQYGDVSLEIEPLERGKNFEFVNKIVGGAIPRNFIPSVEKGIVKAMREGYLAGYPMTDIRVILYDGSYHPVDSSDMAFQIAASMALKKAFDEVGGVLLEPVMNVEIVVPEEFMGQITGDISSRRGKVLGMEVKGKNEAVKALIPLAEMFKYTSDLRSVTGGRGTYSMSFASYEIVPQRIAQGVIEEAKKIKQEEHV
jgi:elongation factor G